MRIAFASLLMVLIVSALLPSHTRAWTSPARAQRRTRVAPLVIPVARLLHVRQSRAMN